MRQRYVSIAAASVTALVVGVGPALAQNTTISPNVNPNIGVNPSVGVGRPDRIGVGERFVVDYDRGLLCPVREF